jgi:ankyrin repeat protein
VHFAAAAACSSDQEALSLLRILLVSRCDVLAVTDAGFSATDVCQESSDDEVMSMLLAAGAPRPNRERRSLFLTSPACAATLVHRYLQDLSVAGLVEEFLRGADPSSPDPARRSPLHLAAAVGSAPLVRLIGAQFGAALNAQDMLGRTPLRMAVSVDEPSEETVATLLSLGADWSIADAEGSTPMPIAVARGRLQLAAMLAVAGAPLPAGAPWSITRLLCPVKEPANLITHHAFAVTSIQRGFLRALEYALSTGAHDVDNLTAHAAGHGPVSSLAFMLSRGGRVDSRITSPVEALFLGGTALHVACGTTAGDRDQQVMLLIERGADVTATLPCGLRPVHVARGASTRALFKAEAEPAARRGSAAVGF